MAHKDFINQKLGKKLDFRQKVSRSKHQFENRAFHQRGLEKRARVKK